MPAPETVCVSYRNLDGVHVFTSDDVRGLYVAGRDLRQAYEEVSDALHDLFKYEGVNASYYPTIPVDEFIGWVERGKIPHPAIIKSADVAYSRAA